tara:strand:+ start:222 stop:587 length:366 start_codon:yes stop_codon:yes gene_type:complete
MPEEITEEFRKSMAEWVELKQQLTDARKDIKVLTDREKELKEFIKTSMKTQQIDTVNLRKGKVSLKTSKRKGTLTKKAVQEGLTKFFGGDEVKIESAINAIYDTIGEVQSDNIALTGVNKE